MATNMTPELEARMHDIIASNGNPSPLPEGMKRPRREYPHLIVRIMCGVYQREDISISEGESDVHVGYFSTRVHHSRPLDEDGELTPECKQLLTDGVREACMRLGFQMCLIWAPNRCTSFGTNRAFCESENIPGHGAGTPEDPFRPVGYGSYKFDTMKTPWNNK